MTEDEAKEEVRKKLSSQAWRLNNLYWIEDENGVKRKFKANEEQIELHNDWHWLNIVLKGRQIGVSTYCFIRVLDFVLFSGHKTAGIIDKTDDDAKKKLARIAFAYDHLDDPDDPVTAKIGALIKAANPQMTDNKKELEFLNGSKIWAGTSMRGGTLQFLWITELGYTSFFNPTQAEEIRKGALNTIHVGNTVIIESTHEGGKFGVFYSLVKVAMEARLPLSVMDWRFVFFAWWRHKKYSLPVDQWYTLTKEEDDYFKKLADLGIKLTNSQKYWYVKKKAAIGDAIFKEYPSLPEECFEAVVKGSIYGRKVTALRAAKRISDFEHDRTMPLFTFWDLGYSDFTALWLLQFCGRDICALSYRCNCRKDPSFYVAVVREWERKYEMPVTTNFLPHDAASHEKSGQTYQQYLATAGLKNTQIVVRTPDEWLGIHHLRSLLPRFVIHKTECGQQWDNEGRGMPSGIECLENYHTKEDGSTGVIRETPVHDENSHGCSALRTFSEADMRGLLPGSSTASSAPVGGARVVMAGWNTTRPSSPMKPRVITN